MTPGGMVKRNACQEDSTMLPKFKENRPLTGCYGAVTGG